MGVGLKKAGRPRGKTPPLPDIENLWLSVWLIMAAVHRYEGIRSAGKRTDGNFTGHLRKIIKLGDEFGGGYGDNTLPIILRMRKCDAHLAKIYRIAKRKQYDGKEQPYRKSVAEFLKMAGLNTAPATVQKFTLAWTAIENPIDTARTHLAKYFGLRAQGNKSILEKYKNYLVNIPDDKNIPPLELLRPLLRVVGHSEPEIQSAIGMLSLNLDELSSSQGSN
jgi:hypothetical protein